MKLRLLQHLACPACYQPLALMNPELVPVQMRAVPGTLCSGLCSTAFSSTGRKCAACGGLEVMGGRLVCGGCGLVFSVTAGVPQLLLKSISEDDRKVRTAESFGFLWTRTADKTSHGGAHSSKTLAALSCSPPVGTILDAGCGDGSDTAALARRARAEVVGVDISDGGTRVAFERTRRLPNAHVVRADLCQLPFRASEFDFIYSYGVIHHLPVPSEAMAELARVSQPGAGAAIYLYEDFSERAPALRWSLRAANTWRKITTRMPHALLYALCAGAAPFVYLGFTVPHKILRHLPLCRALADAMPFRHGRTPLSLTGDLYDRFSAPVEHRYSRQTASQLAREAGFSVRQLREERGWMLELRRDAEAQAPVYNSPTHVRK